MSKLFVDSRIHMLHHCFIFINRQRFASLGSPLPCDNYKVLQTPPLESSQELPLVELGHVSTLAAR